MWLVIRVYNVDEFACVWSPDATTGATDDWAKLREGVKHPICPELRGNDFAVLPSQIALSFNEIWAGIVAQEGAIAAEK